MILVPGEDAISFFHFRYEARELSLLSQVLAAGRAVNCHLSQSVTIFQSVSRIANLRSFVFMLVMETPAARQPRHDPMSNVPDWI